MPLLAIQNQQVVVISNLIACYDVSPFENCHFISLLRHAFLVEDLEDELLAMTLYENFIGLSNQGNSQSSGRGN